MQIIALEMLSCFASYPPCSSHHRHSEPHQRQRAAELHRGRADPNQGLVLERLRRAAQGCGGPVGPRPPQHSADRGELARGAGKVVAAGTNVRTEIGGERAQRPVASGGESMRSQ